MFGAQAFATVYFAGAPLLFSSPTSTVAYTVSLSVKDSAAAQGRITTVQGTGATGH